MAYGQTPKDAGGIPIGSVYVPNTGIIPLQGANSSSDGSSNTSAPGCFARAAVTVATQASALQTANGNSADLAVGSFAELAIDINLTGNQGTSPTIQFFVERKGADGVYYAIYSGSVLSATGPQSISLGAGCATNQAFGAVARLRWIIGGTSTPGWTFSYSIIGK